MHLKSMIKTSNPESNLVVLELKEIVSGKEYREIVPYLEDLMAKNRTLHFLIRVDEIESFTFGAAFEDLKFDLTHLKYIGKTVILGDKESYRKLAERLDKIFPKEIKFYPVADQVAAKEWLLSGD